MRAKGFRAFKGVKPVSGGGWSVGVDLKIQDLRKGGAPWATTWFKRLIDQLPRAGLSAILLA